MIARKEPAFRPSAVLQAGCFSRETDNLINYDQSGERPMTYPKSLAADARVYDVFAMRPATFGPFTETCEQIMRGPSPLSPAQRELIGTFVSRLNSCPYCHDVHNQAVKAYGMDGELTRQLMEDPGAALQTLARTRGGDK